jgi:hypothetical protein
VNFLEKCNPYKSMRHIVGMAQKSIDAARKAGTAQAVPTKRSYVPEMRIRCPDCTFKTQLKHRCDLEFHLLDKHGKRLVDLADGGRSVVTTDASLSILAEHGKEKERRRQQRHERYEAAKRRAPEPLAAPGKRGRRDTGVVPAPRGEHRPKSTAQLATQLFETSNRVERLRQLLQRRKAGAAAAPVRVATVSLASAAAAGSADPGAARAAYEPYVPQLVRQRSPVSDAARVRRIYSCSERLSALNLPAQRSAALAIVRHDFPELSREQCSDRLDWVIATRQTLEKGQDKGETG